MEYAYNKPHHSLALGIFLKHCDNTNNINVLIVSSDVTCNLFRLFRIQQMKETYVFLIKIGIYKVNIIYIVDIYKSIIFVIIHVQYFGY